MLEEDYSEGCGKEDPFDGYNTLTYTEEGTCCLSKQEYVDVHVAAGLLCAYADPRVLNVSPVEVKYFVCPDVKVYLLRNRVMRKENAGLRCDFNIKERGPVVVFRCGKRKHTTLPNVVKNNGVHTKPVEIPVRCSSFMPDVFRVYSD